MWVPEFEAGDGLYAVDSGLLQSKQIIALCFALAAVDKATGATSSVAREKLGEWLLGADARHHGGVRRTGRVGRIGRPGRR